MMNFLENDLSSMTFIGEVVQHLDPEKEFRCKVKVFGKFDTMDVEDIPWAYPRLPSTHTSDGGSGTASTPKMGSLVEVHFESGDIHHPTYSAMPQVSADVKALVTDSYEDAHVILADKTQEISMYYTKTQGFIVDLKGSYMLISNDGSITIEHKDTKSVIELRGGVITMTADSEINVTARSRVHLASPEVWLDGKVTKNGHTPNYTHTRHEPLWQFLTILAQAVDAKLYPTPGVMQNAAAQFEQLSKAESCKVS